MGDVVLHQGRAVLSRSVKTTDKCFVVAAVAAAVAGTCLHALYATDSYCSVVGSDDAYISYRYAENLFHGHGLVYNPGEYVEGYSNFLYTLLMVPGFLFGKANVYHFSVGINIALLAAGLVQAFIAAKPKLGAGRARFYVLALGLSPFLWANAATGLETCLVLLVTIAVWPVLERFAETGARRDLICLAAWFTISVLTRVDGFILPVVCLFYLAVKGRGRAAVILSAVLLADLSLYTVFRLWYYGDIIANTFYVKIIGDQALRLKNGWIFYSSHWVQTWLVFGLIGGYLVLTVRRRDEGSVVQQARNLFSRIDFPFVWCIAWSAYALSLGGDAYMERFLVPVMPFALYLLVRHTLYFNALHGAVVFTAALTVPFWYAYHDFRFGYLHIRDFNYSARRYDCWINLGTFLGERFPGASLAVDAAGKIPYYSELYTIDMLGLSNRHIAKGPVRVADRPGHGKFDEQYVLSRKPVVIAAWFAAAFDSLNLGLTRRLFEKDYTLKYLVYTNPGAGKGAEIMDVEGQPADALGFLNDSGYGYAVLVRKDYPRPW